MVNNRYGFTIIELLATVVIISIISVFVLSNIKSTLSFGSKEAYDLMKRNIVLVSYDYIKECKANTIECDFDYDKNNTISVLTLKEKGYLKSIESPIDGKDLGNCLYVVLKEENGVAIVDLKDECY